MIVALVLSLAVVFPPAVFLGQAATTVERKAHTPFGRERHPRQPRCSGRLVLCAAVSEPGRTLPTP